MGRTWAAWVQSGVWQSDTEALPLKPRLLGDVLEVALDGDVEARRLIRLVAREPVLTASVLRLANSAAHAALRPATTVDQAVVRVGTRAVRSTVLSVCFASSPTLPGQAAPDPDYVDHGIGTACIAGLIATRAGVDPEEAFVCGLLHDIGKLFLLNLRTRFIRNGGTAPSPEEHEAVMRDFHAVVGGLALERWSLPDTLRAPVRWHHEPFSTHLHRDAASVVYAANRLSHRLGFGCAEDIEDRPVDDPVCDTLDLTETWMTDTEERARVLFEAARQFASPRSPAYVPVACAS